MESVISRLACKQGRNDEAPNIELAEDLCQNKDTAGIDEIITGFKGADRAVANDCIKVLYEIGERKPELISGYANEFLPFLHSKNNRLAWGSMTALAAITAYASDTVFAGLLLVLSAYENGSVITVDNSISVFAKLCKADNRYAETVLPILISHLQKCRPKDVAQHAERASVCFSNDNASAFTEALEARMHDLAPSQQARIKKLIKKLHDL
ncbi:MAG: hypothetical protein LBH09_01120 [Peptococcaceae bacterium]|nr:hypothetical protein [Peptococcaceae bacterium]